MGSNFLISFNVKARDFKQSVIISYPYKGIITTMSSCVDSLHNGYNIDLVVSSIYSGRVIERCHFIFKDLDQCLAAENTLEGFVSFNCNESVSSSSLIDDFPPDYIPPLKDEDFSIDSDQIECEDFSIDFNPN